MLVGERAGRSECVMFRGSIAPIERQRPRAVEEGIGRVVERSAHRSRVADADGRRVVQSHDWWIRSLHIDSDGCSIAIVLTVKVPVREHVEADVSASGSVGERAVAVEAYRAVARAANQAGGDRIAVGVRIVPQDSGRAYRPSVILERGVRITARDGWIVESWINHQRSAR